MSNSENNGLLKRIEELETEVNLLKKEKENRVIQERERIITEEKLEFSWAGNLGRWDWDYKTGEVAFNPLKVQTLGYEYSEVEPHVTWFTAQIHPDDYDPTMDNMKEHLMGKIPVYEVEYRMKTKSGSYKWFYDRGRVVEKDKEGKPLRLTGIVFDITERKEAEIELKNAKEKLEIANKTKDKFFSIIAHDLRSPLLTLMSFIQLLQQSGDTLTAEEFKEMLSDIETSVKSTESLLDNLLKWAMTQINQISVKREKLPLSKYAEFIHDNIENTAESKDIKLRIEFPDDTQINADFNMTSTIIRNLINNSIKFSNHNSEIIISAEKSGKGTLFKIQDFGKGMDKETQEILFNPDTSIRTRGTDNEKGTGLGLKICYEFVKLHNGEIKVESELEKGSTFTFFIPE